MTEEKSDRGRFFPTGWKPDNSLVNFLQQMNFFCKSLRRTKNCSAICFLTSSARTSIFLELWVWNQLNSKFDWIGRCWKQILLFDSRRFGKLGLEFESDWSLFSLSTTLGSALSIVIKLLVRCPIYDTTRCKKQKKGSYLSWKWKPILMEFGASSIEKVF